MSFDAIDEEDPLLLPQPCYCFSVSVSQSVLLYGFLSNNLLILQVSQTTYYLSEPHNTLFPAKNVRSSSWVLEIYILLTKSNPKKNHILFLKSGPRFFSSLLLLLYSCASLISSPSFFFSVFSVSLELLFLEQLVGLQGWWSLSPLVNCRDWCLEWMSFLLLTFQVVLEWKDSAWQSDLKKTCQESWQTSFRKTGVLLSLLRFPSKADQSRTWQWTTRLSEKRSLARLPLLLLLLDLQLQTVECVSFLQYFYEGSSTDSSSRVCLFLSRTEGGESNLSLFLLNKNNMMMGL